MGLRKYINAKTTILRDLCALTLSTKAPMRSFGFLKKSLKPEEIVCSYRNVKFWVRKADWPSVREVFIQDEYSCLKALFPSRDQSPKILDLGAHIGCFALKTFSLLPSARICSAEAAHDTADILEKNIALNSGLNWSLKRAAIWQHNNGIYLQRTQSPLGHKVITQDNGENIDSVTLKTLCEDLGWNSIDLIKMDIEGAEEAVLPDSQEILAKTNALIIEVHTDRIDGDAVIKILNQDFTHCYKLNHRGSTKPVYVFTRRDIGVSKKWARA